MELEYIPYGGWVLLTLKATELWSLGRFQGSKQIYLRVSPGLKYFPQVLILYGLLLACQEYSA